MIILAILDSGAAKSTSRQIQHAPKGPKAYQATIKLQAQLLLNYLCSSALLRSSCHACRQNKTGPGRGAARQSGRPRAKAREREREREIDTENTDADIHRQRATQRDTEAQIRKDGECESERVARIPEY